MHLMSLRLFLLFINLRIVANHLFPVKLLIFIKFYNFNFYIFIVYSVTSISQKEKSKTRPIALNTVEMLRVASASLGIGPQQAMHIAEKLYIQVGDKSYPRSFSSSL